MADITFSNESVVGAAAVLQFWLLQDNATNPFASNQQASSNTQFAEHS